MRKYKVKTLPANVKIRSKSKKFAGREVPGETIFRPAPLWMLNGYFADVWRTRASSRVNPSSSGESSTAAGGWPVIFANKSS